MSSTERRYYCVPSIEYADLHITAPDGVPTEETVVYVKAYKDPYASQFVIMPNVDIGPYPLVYEGVLGIFSQDFNDAEIRMRIVKEEGSDTRRFVWSHEIIQPAGVQLPEDYVFPYQYIRVKLSAQAQQDLGDMITFMTEDQYGWPRGITVPYSQGEMEVGTDEFFMRTLPFGGLEGHITDITGGSLPCTDFTFGMPILSFPEMHNLRNFVMPSVGEGLCLAYLPQNTMDLMDLRQYPKGGAVQMFANMRSLNLDGCEFDILLLESYEGCELLEIIGEFAIYNGIIDLSYTSLTDFYLDGLMQVTYIDNISIIRLNEALWNKFYPSAPPDVDEYMFNGWHVYRHDKDLYG